MIEAKVDVSLPPPAAEETSRGSVEQFRVLADAIPHLIWMANADGWRYWYNRRWYEYTGTTPEQMEGRGWQSVHDPETLPAVLERFKESIATGEPFDMVSLLRAADGVFRRFLTRVQPVKNAQGRVVQWFGTNTDVDDLKQAEEALRESEERFRNLADHMSQFAWMAHPNGWIFWYNQRWFDYTGATLEEMKGWGWMKVHHPDHVDRVVKRIQQSWDTGEPWEDIFPLRGRDGNYRWFLSRALPIRDENGAIVRWFGTNTDVTEQRAAENALRESKERLEGLIQSTTDAVIAIGKDQRIVLFNPAAEQVFACPMADAIGSSIDRFIPATLREAHRDHVRKFGIAGVTSRRMGALGTLSAVRANGEEFPIEASISQVTVGGRTLYTAIVRDITEREQAKEIQELLFREMNHRVKNLYAIVDGMIAVSARSARTPQEMAQSLRGRLDALIRAHNLVRPERMDIEPAHGEQTTMDALVRTVLLPHMDSKDARRRIIASGPDVVVGAKAVTSLALTLHESATNAAKYGALSDPNGSIRVEWRAQDANLHLQWEETGGPTIIVSPEMRGFGSVLADRSIGQLGGKIDRDWQRTGLTLRLMVPLEQLGV